jgi:hypothetical protein
MANEKVPIPIISFNTFTFKNWISTWDINDQTTKLIAIIIIVFPSIKNFTSL